MIIRSTLLISLVSVGVAGCQHKAKTQAPLTTASISSLGSDEGIPAPIPVAKAPEPSAKTSLPAPTVTASAPTFERSEVTQAPIENLTVEQAVGSEIQPLPTAPRAIRGGNNPISAAFNAVTGRGSEQLNQGRPHKFGRPVIAARSRSRTQKVIIEDDLTRDNYELDSGDRIRLSVFEQRNLSRIYSVDSGGFISVPLVGNIFVRGATTRSVEKIVAKKLSKKYIRDPKVSVEINRYRPFYILGQVRNSGSFSFVNGMTVRSAIAVAGGYTARANKRKVLLTRRLNKKRITTYVQPGYYIRPGDTLEIRERFF